MTNQTITNFASVVSAGLNIEFASGKEASNTDIATILIEDTKRLEGIVLESIEAFESSAKLTVFSAVQSTEEGDVKAFVSIESESKQVVFVQSGSQQDAEILLNFGKHGDIDFQDDVAYIGVRFDEITSELVKAAWTSEKI